MLFHHVSPLKFLCDLTNLNLPKAQPGSLLSILLVGKLDRCLLQVLQQVFLAPRQTETCDILAPKNVLSGREFPASEA